MVTTTIPKPNTSPQSEIYRLDVNQVAEHLNVDPAAGLSDTQAAERLETYGSNELTGGGIKNPLLILWEQMIDPMVLVLLGAAVVSLFLGETKSVIAIMAIVILNAMLGVSQEWRAEKAMAALKKMAAPLVRVRRSGTVCEVESGAVVPGDVVLLEAGSVVPADGRVIQSMNMSIQEASLTGESVAVDKHSNALADDNPPLGDRFNMAYMGTAVTAGRGEVLISATGMQTELGRIARLIQDVETEQTPLQGRMAQLGKALFFVAIGIIAVGSLIGFLNLQPGETIADVFLAAVAMAVAVVPEGLPAVVTIALALGSQRMLRRRALIRKLPAVETLGSVTVIASDKTGTLTQNQMEVQVIETPDHRHRLPINNGTGLTNSDQMLLISTAMCNDATLKSDGSADGDPTEIALLRAAVNNDLDNITLAAALPRVAEVPFTSERKRMSTIHDINDGAALPHLAIDADTDQIVFTKGAVDNVLDVCAHVVVDGKIVALDRDRRSRLNEQDDALAADGLRVLGIAYKPLNHMPQTVNVESIEHDLVFLGMVGMIDPPRPEVREAVDRALHAGIRPIMITGDHPLTAFSIARDLGIVAPDAKADQGMTGNLLTGRDLETLSADDLEAAVEHVQVYARVSPEHKLRVVEALQKRGHIAAMTGDGVNDAPALKKANIGVAMGITGTPVAKEASEMVILDDNFTTIVEAAEEGRTIYDNVRKFVKYILASNTGEVGVLFITQLMGMPLPLNTLQILWMNLVTDGVPALALSVEKGEPNAMSRPPHQPGENVFARGLGWYLVRVGFLIGVLGMGVVLLFPQADPALWSTMVFTTLVFSQMGHAIAIRSEHDSVFKIGLFSNKAMLAAVGSTVLLQIVLIYAPFAQNIFGTVPLSLGQLALSFALALITFIGVELDKRVFADRVTYK